MKEKQLVEGHLLLVPQGMCPDFRFRWITRRDIKLRKISLVNDNQEKNIVRIIRSIIVYLLR